MKLRATDERHPSEFALARYSAGETSPSDGERIRSHLGQCPACARSFEALQAFRRDFAQHHDRSAFLLAVQQRSAETVERPAWYRALLGPLPLGAVAAALALVVLAVVLPWRSADDAKPGAAERVKGIDLELGYLVEEDGRAVVAEPGRVLHPGDRIQFRLSAPRGDFVHLVGVDQAGQVSVYFPRPGEANESFPGGVGRPVPGSVILDRTLGRERVFVLICKRPLNRDTLAARVRGLAADPRVWIDESALPVDCRQTSLVLHKE